MCTVDWVCVLRRAFAELELLLSFCFLRRALVWNWFFLDFQAFSHIFTYKIFWMSFRTMFQSQCCMILLNAWLLFAWLIEDLISIIHFFYAHSYMPCSMEICMRTSLYVFAVRQWFIVFLFAKLFHILNQFVFLLALDVLTWSVSTLPSKKLILPCWFLF